jgi:hypothetical protein
VRKALRDKLELPAIEEFQDQLETRVLTASLVKTVPTELKELKVPKVHLLRGLVAFQETW